MLHQMRNSNGHCICPAFVITAIYTYVSDRKHGIELITQTNHHHKTFAQYAERCRLNGMNLIKGRHISMRK